MNQRLLFLLPHAVVVVLFVGCQDPAATPTTGAAQTPGSITYDQTATERVDVADVLDILNLNVWKSPINQPGSDPVKKVSLCVKRKESEPEVVAWADLSRKGELSRGELLVYLYVMPGSDKPQYKFGFIHNSENLNAQRAAAFVEDPLTSHPDFGGMTATDKDALVGVPGITVLHSADFDGLSDTGIEGQAKAAGFYVKNE